jgi:hypothetical protein
MTTQGYSIPMARLWIGLCSTIVTGFGSSTIFPWTSKVKEFPSMIPHLGSGDILVFHDNAATLEILKIIKRRILPLRWENLTYYRVEIFSFHPLLSTFAFNVSTLYPSSLKMLSSEKLVRTRPEI